MSLMKLLVLGGNGYVGKNIVEYFSKNNEYEVFSPRRGDLNLLDTDSVEKYISKNKPDVVIHSAVNIASVEENLQFYFNVQRCSEQFGKLIVIGSGAEYDMRHYYPMMTEEYFGRYIPADTYGISKFVASNDIENSNFNAVNLRVLGIFGKYEDYKRRFISNNICRAKCGFSISMHQNMKFDYLYVNDFVRILEKFVRNDAKHKNYNICTSKPIELLELANIIKEVHGDTNIEVVVSEGGMKLEYSADNSRFMNEFGLYEFTDFRSSVKELYEWYDANIDLSEYCQELKAKETK